MPNLTPDQLKALAVNTDDMADTLEWLVDRYTPDEQGRGLDDARAKIITSRAWAVFLRHTAKGGQA